MITLKLQFILLTGSLACLIILINMIRRYKLELKYTLLWLIMMSIVLLLSVFPGSFSVISSLMGITLPVNGLYLVAIFCIFLILFSLTASVSRATNKIKELSQELGMLKHEFEKLKRSQETGSENL